MRTARNNKALLEMIGLMFVLFTVTSGGVVFNKYTVGNVVDRSVAYQGAIQLYRDQRGAETFYTDLANTVVREQAEKYIGDLDNFCVDDVDTYAMREVIMVAMNNELAKVQNTYKDVYLLPKVKKVEINRYVSEHDMLNIQIIPDGLLTLKHGSGFKEVTSSSNIESVVIIKPKIGCT